MNVDGDGIVPFDEPISPLGEATPAILWPGADESGAAAPIEGMAGAAAPIEGMVGAAAPIEDIAGAAAPIEGMAGAAEFMPIELIPMELAPIGAAELMTGAPGVEAAGATGVVRVIIGEPGQTGQVTVVTTKPDGT